MNTVYTVAMTTYTAGAIYDINKSYTDVFIVVGCVYIVATLVVIIIVVVVVATLVFGAIPLLQYFREGSLPIDEMNGATRFETFRISTKRSTSRGSIANGVDGAAPPPPATAAAADSSAALTSAYGAITTTGGGVDVGGHGYGYGGGVPDWNGTRSGSGQMSPPLYGSLQ